MNYKNYKLDLQLFAESESGVETGVSNEEAKTTKQEQTVPKSLFDKKMSEFADTKKKLQEKMTDEEKQHARLLDLEQELENLRREKRESSIIASLSKTPLDEVAISSIAKALLDGDEVEFCKVLVKGMDKVMADKTAEIERLKLEITAHPSTNATETTVLTREEVSKMSTSEKQKLYEQNPEYFKSLYE